MDDRITRRATAQHGLVARRQLLALGLKADTVDAAVRRGNLVRVACGVYAVPGSPATSARDLMTASLRCGPDALVVGEPMLAMLRVQGARPEAPPIVLVRPGRRVSNVPWAWSARADDWPGQRAEVHGIPSANVTWNLLEAAAHPDAIPDPVLERLSDGVRWSGRRAVAAIRAAVEEHHRTHPGAARLRTSGLFSDAAPESPPERVLAARFAHHGALTQVEVIDGVRVDVLLPTARIILEYQGYTNHSAAGDRARDQVRADRLRAAGYIVIPVRQDDLDDLDAFVARIDLLVDTVTAVF